VDLGAGHRCHLFKLADHQQPGLCRERVGRPSAAPPRRAGPGAFEDLFGDQEGGLGLRHERTHGGLHRGQPVRGALPERDDLQHLRGLQPDHLQRFVLALYLEGDDHRSLCVITRGAGLSGLDVHCVQETRNRGYEGIDVLVQRAENRATVLKIKRIEQREKVAYLESLH